MNYKKASSIGEALAMLNETDNALILAGGTDVMADLNRAPSPDKTVIYIGDIEELKIIRETVDGIHIGSLVPAAEIAESEIVGKYAAALRDAAGESAGPQVRNRATIGGNIATASPAGDMICALFALDAAVAVAHSDRESGAPAEGAVRTEIRKISELITGARQTALKANEIITEIIIPKAPGASGSAFLKMGKRKAMSISIVNAACAVTLGQENRIDAIRIALGSVAPTVVRAETVENELAGKPADKDLIAEITKLAAGAIDPITDQRAPGWYRREIVPVLAARAVMAAVCDAGGMQESVG